MEFIKHLNSNNMPALSDSKNDVFVWIVKIMRSRTSVAQNSTCIKLIALFDEHYKDDAMTFSLQKRM